MPIKYVQDRPGYDRRYAIDNIKINTHLGWSPKYTFMQRMKETIEWYLLNKKRIEYVVSDEYKSYYFDMYLI